MPSAEQPRDPRHDLVACVDFGSTFTKVVVVDVRTGEPVGLARHPTTIHTDVLDGLDACLDELAADLPGVRAAEVLACSSAGGGLRIAVVGNEELVTAEAGRRVALSSGGTVVHVCSGGLDPVTDPAKLAELEAARPDVVLLTGGTDGGELETVVRSADFLGSAGWPGPVVFAGNVEGRGRAEAAFEESQTPYALADNVVPRIGVLAPESARSAIREMFLAHVIGGKHLSARTDFAAMVRGATPDIVLTAVELLAGTVGDVVVVDVGGATTDVHSAVELDPEEAQLAREVVATTAVTRTVEGDLGMRWSAVSTADAAEAVGLGDEGLLAAADRRTDDPSYLADTPVETSYDERLATTAVVLALRRHAGRSKVVLGPGGRVVERTGKDLREVGLLVGSGGALRNAPAATARRILEAGTAPGADGWQLPEHAVLRVDTDHLLAAVGLLADRYPTAAHGVASRLLRGRLT